MNIAIILSAGSGNRFKNDIPKQFIDLNGQPIVLSSLDKFQKSSFIDGIVVVCHPDHAERTKGLVSEYKKVIAIVEGGQRRQDSVLNALMWIKHNTKCTKVWIHDSARPLFTTDLLVRLHEASSEQEAVIPVIPSEDTLKRVDHGIVSETLDRSRIYRVQTPQVFNFELIYDAYNEFSKTSDVTDDASLIELFGVKISIVEGEASNIKITYPMDIRVAELLMKASNTL